MNLSNLPQLKLQLVSMLHCIPMVKVFKDMLKKRARSARFWICTAVHGYSQLRSQYKGKQWQRRCHPESPQPLVVLWELDVLVLHPHQTLCYPPHNPACTGFTNPEMVAVISMDRARRVKEYPEFSSLLFLWIQNLSCCFANCLIFTNLSWGKESSYFTSKHSPMLIHLEEMWNVLSLSNLMLWNTFFSFKLFHIIDSPGVLT